jgi:hypothetical protein
MTKYQIPFCGSQIVPYRWTDRTKVTVAFHNFVNMPKNSVYINVKGKGKVHPRIGPEGPERE